MTNFFSKLAIAGILASQIVEATKGGPEPKWLTDLRAKREKEGSNYSHTYVHLINHTHDDVGWLKTVDEYFTGSKTNIQRAAVSQVLDEVVNELIKNPDRKFTYVEMKFFSMWWDRQPAGIKTAVRELVEQGRLEFVNAGWSMHDEACTHHDDMMNNMMIGHEFLEREFGYKPRIAWSIDPFGHSNGQPRLLADMGFDAWFYARLDYEDKTQRLQDQSMNYIWRPMSDSLGESVEIFTGAMRDHYCWIPGFWMDEKFDGDDPVVSDETKSTFNADYKTQLMYDYVQEMIPGYRGNHMLIPMGCDFAFGNARMNFKSTDNLIEYFNSHIDDVTLLYSTPGMYLDALKTQEIAWPTNYDDMFPYADQNEDYWTGFFTSRPNAKSEVRFGQADLHASNKIFAQKAIDQSVTDNQIESILDAKFAMFDAMGVYQHHDGITGTAMQHVADDYTRRLKEGMAASNQVYTDLMAELIREKSGLQADDWSMCTQKYGTYKDCPTADFTFYRSTGDQRNIDGGQGCQFNVAAHNPSTVQSDIQRFKVKPGSYNVAVLDEILGQWRDVESNLECYDYQLNGGSSMSDCNLFISHPISANDFAFFYVTNSTTIKEGGDVYQSKLTYQGQSTDDAAHFTYQVGDGVIDLDFQLRYYTPGTPLTEFYQNSDNCPSGAYIFKPAMNDQSSHPYGAFVKRTEISGSFMHTDVLFYQSTDATYTALVRNFADSEILEFEVQMVGIQSKGIKKGKEVTATWKVNGFDNSQTFYTDTNGLEMQKRVLNFRPTWDLVTDEHVSANYYPINQAIAIRDTQQNLQMTVMNDRSQGGSVIDIGRIELMQNRRLYYDDYRGVEEPLNEVDAKGYGIQVDALYRAQIFNSTEVKSLQRQTQLMIDEPVQYMFSQSADNQALPPVDAKVSVEFDGDLKIHLFTEAKNQILIRIENIADLFDGTPAATPMFDINGYASQLYFSINSAAPESVSIVERTLGNNQDFQEWSAQRFHWTNEDGEGKVMPSDSETKVALQPQRIRLFRVVYNASPTELKI